MFINRILSLMPSSSRLIALDRACDGIPFIGSANNLINLFQKCVIIPLMTPKKISESRYFSYLNNKSTTRCVTLMVPVLGPIVTSLYDKTSYAKKNDIDFARKMVRENNIKWFKHGTHSIVKSPECMLSAIKECLSELKLREGLEKISTINGHSVSNNYQPTGYRRTFSDGAYSDSPPLDPLDKLRDLTNDMDHSLKSNREFILNVVKEYFSLISALARTEENTSSNQAISGIYGHIKHMIFSDELRTDTNFILEALQGYFISFKEKSKDFILQSIENLLSSIGRIGDRNVELTIEIFKKHVSFFQEFKFSDTDFVQEVIQQLSPLFAYGEDLQGYTQDIEKYFSELKNSEIQEKYDWHFLNYLKKGILSIFNGGEDVDIEGEGFFNFNNPNAPIFS